jgi:hypothetical protein
MLLWVTGGGNVARYLKRRFLVAVLVIAVVGLAGTAWADMFPPSHGCRKPYKPYQFTSEHELEMFRAEVDRFEACIDRFVEEQKEAAQAHRDAAKAAIDDWNRFVRLELR